MKWFAVLWLTCLPALQAPAGLQNLTLGGSIEVGSAWYSSYYNPDEDGFPWIPDEFLVRNPIGPFGTRSYYRTDGRGNSLFYVEQHTRLNLSADFTDNVQAFIEFDSIDVWGEDFRSDGITGSDVPAFSADDVSVYQSYIETSEVEDLPLRLRIGRQEMSYGTGWLVGTNPVPDPFSGLSFDAVRLTYATDSFSLDLWTSKLAETGAAEEDGDIDFHGLYAACSVLEHLTFDAYWMILRDAQSLNDTNLSWQAEWLEQVLRLDNYDPTNLHTVGLRTAGSWDAFEFSAEAAWQFGEADAVGNLFRLGDYGDDSARFDGNWGANLELSYTFDAKLSPCLYFTGAYFSGEDNRDISLVEWTNPFDRHRASVSFNRLFSDYEYDYLIDISALTNCWLVQGGVSLSPSDKFDVSMDATYLEAVESYDRPWSFYVGDTYVPLAPNYPFLARSGAEDIGWQIGMEATYGYSDDVSYTLGWGHLFPGEAFEDGAFSDENGLRYLGGNGREDVDYVYGLLRVGFGEPGEGD